MKLFDIAFQQILLGRPLDIGAMMGFCRGTRAEQQTLLCDVFGVTEERATLITAKVGQVTSVIDSFWHHV
jgi:hypothetical protein